MITTLLLAAILVVELLRLYLPYRPQNRKGHFTQKLLGATKMIWDLEFKVFKTREIREDIRREYDACQSKLFAIGKQIESAKEEDKPNYEDTRTLLTRDIARYEAQMKQLDDEINGVAPNQEDHAGSTGIISQIDSFKELEGMLKSFIKSL